MVWTSELVSKLKKLWYKGLTTVEIGNCLGMSKNAIVGKAHRLGLESRPSPIKHENLKILANKTIKKPVETEVDKDLSNQIMQLKEDLPLVHTLLHIEKYMKKHKKFVI